MATKIILPKQGLQMTSGVITKWLIKEGEKVTKDNPLFEMETDKLTITIDAQADGTLLKIIHSEGEEVPITETIGIIGEVGEDISEILKEENTEAKSEKKSENISAPAGKDEEKSSKTQQTAENKDGRIFITPRARTVAESKNLDISAISGTGPDGLIIERDVLSFEKIKATPLAVKTAKLNGVSLNSITAANGKIRKSDVTAGLTFEGETQEKTVKISGMRKAISENMQKSLTTMAQANHRINVDMSECRKIREAFKLKDKKVSFNDIVVFLLTRALLEYPEINCTADEENIYFHENVNIGVAVAVNNGLIVPTVRNCEEKTLLELHDETAALVAKARDGKLSRNDYTGGTFTVTNLGMYDIDSFTAIINPPQVGILAVGKISDTPVVVNGQVVIRPMCTLSLTYDHRIVDGAPAAQFLQRLKTLIENPYILMA